MNSSGIYQIKNLINGKVYVGSSVNIRNRIRDHKWELKQNKHINKHLQNAWNKNGVDSFVFSILEICSIDSLILNEQKWIDSLNSFKNGYNKCPAAGSKLGLKYSDEEKSRIYFSRAGAINGMFGRSHSPEAKEKMSKYKKGVTVSLETKIKMSIASKGCNNGMFGKNHSIEAKAKVSKANSRENLSPERLAKMSASQLGRKHTEESKLKMSLSRKGQVVSKEQRAKISVANAFSWAKRKGVLFSLVYF